MTDASVEETSVQIIYDANGTPLFAAVPHGEFEELLAMARRASGLEAAAEAIRSETGRLSLIPSEVVHRIAKGEHPIRVWRLHRGLNAVDLARDAGISPGLLSEIESGKKDPQFQTIVRIAKTLDVRLDELVPVIDEEAIDEHRREVQLRDIARRISEIDSMINGRSGFDSGAVRDAAQSLISEAETFMRERQGKFGWLETVTDKARTIINEINAAEKAIVNTVTETQGRLAEVFSDSLVRAGLFPKEMSRDARAEQPAGNGIETSRQPTEAEDAPAAEPKSPDAEAHRRSAELDDESRAKAKEERPRGWFPR